MKLFDTVKSALLDGITELDAPYACDLHYYLYSLPNHFIYYASAREATADGRGVIVQNLRRLGRSKMLASRRNRLPSGVSSRSSPLSGALSLEDLEEMRLKAQQWFEDHPHGLLDIWESP